ncbi:MAG: site-specific DNA-methyltransferase [Prevotellaceae bacterium]|jgi:site-specific DNA-methyltransferase (adenine-specific)|nr:site-specific DNA-methyltransferase [Prevotellaceae bacterium]
MQNITELLNKIICGDCNKILQEIPANSVDCVITSPPYFCQREYGGGGIGNETKVEEYIDNLIRIFHQCVRVIKPTGTIVFNLGDKYIDGNLLLVPYRFAIEIQKENIVKLINELTWVKVNPTPKQCLKKLIPATEPFFIFSKTDDYYFNRDAFLDYKDKLCGSKKKAGNDVGKKYFELIEKSNLSNEEKTQAKKELNEVIMEAQQGKIESFRMKIRGLHALPYGGQAGGRLTQIENKGFTIIKIYGNSMRRDVIESNVETIKGNIHPAIYPEFLIQEILKLLTKEGDFILDPFLGSGTTAVVAQRLKRNYIGIEIHSEYVNFAENRIKQDKNNYTLDLFI